MIIIAALLRLINMILRAYWWLGVIFAIAATLFFLLTIFIVTLPAAIIYCHLPFRCHYAIAAIAIAAFHYSFATAIGFRHATALRQPYTIIFIHYDRDYCISEIMPDCRLRNYFHYWDWYYYWCRQTLEIRGLLREGERQPGLEEWLLPWHKIIISLSLLFAFIYIATFHVIIYAITILPLCCYAVLLLPLSLLILLITPCIYAIHACIHWFYITLPLLLRHITPSYHMSRHNSCRGTQFTIIIICQDHYHCLRLNYCAGAYMR